MQWACYFFFLGQPELFPPSKLGRMIGYSNLIIALVGDGPPEGLKSFVHYAAWPADAFGRYQLVHAVLAFIIVCCVSFPLHLRREMRRRGKAPVASAA